MSLTLQRMLGSRRNSRVIGWLTAHQLSVSATKQLCFLLWAHLTACPSLPGWKPVLLADCCRYRRRVWENLTDMECVWFHHLCIGSPCIFINCVCVSRGGVLIMRVWDVKYMNHETPAGTRLMESVCVCVCGCFNSELISFGKKKGVWYREHTHTLLCVWYVVRKLHVH